MQYDYNTSTSAYNISATFFADDVYAQRLTLWFDGFLVARLYLNGTQVGSNSSPQPGGTTNDLVVTVTHPYPTTFADAVQTSVINSGQQTTIGTAWGVSGKEMAALHQEAQNQAIADGVSATAENMLGQSLLLVWDNFIGQSSKAVDMLSRMANCTTVMHHFIGTIGNQVYGSGNIKTVNSFLGAWSPSPLDTSTDVDSVGVTASLMFQVLESAAHQQVTGIVSADPIQAIKTVNLAGTKIYDAKSSNWTTGTNVKSIMSTAGYSSAVLTKIENDLITATPAWRVAMPETFNITMGSFSNFYAYMGVGASGSAGASSTLVGQTWFGSKGVVAGGYQDPATFNAASKDNARQANGFGMPGVGASASVNMLNGRYEYSVTDLTVGNQGMPYELAFTRSYNTALRLTFEGMGYGWSHNWMMNAKKNSEGFIAMGDQQVSGAAAAITALYVTRDIALSDNTLPINNVVISCIVQNFLYSQLVDNVVRLRLSGGVVLFTLLPDGTYLPPAGMNGATQLVLSSGQYIMTTAEKVVFTFNASGTINKIQHPFMPTANAIAFTYDGGGTRITQVSNGFRQLNFTYDGYGQLATVNDGNSHSVTFTIDYSTGNLTSVTNPLSQSTTYQYDQRGRLTKVFRPANPSSPVVTNVYDGLHRVKQQKDAYDNVWNFYLAGNRSQETAPNSTSRVVYFNSKGSVVKTVNALGQAVTTQYDGLQRPVLVTSPEGDSTGTIYDANGNMLSVTQNPKPGSGLSSRTSSYTYDSTWTSQVSTATDPAGNVTSTTYAGTSSNGAGKPTQVVQPSATTGGSQPTTTSTYNSYGQVLTLTDPTGVVSSNSYDSVTHDLLSTQVDPSGLNIQTQFTYDAVGNMLTTTDPKGNVTTAVYDVLRRATQVTGPSPMSPVAYVTYDVNGNVTQTRSLASTDSNTQVIAATYTIDDKVATVVGPANTGEGSQPIPTYYEYDNMRRMMKVTDPLGHQATTAFDAISRPTSNAINGITQQTLTYTTNGKVQSIKDANNNTTQYTYDGFNRPVQITYPDSTLESITYNNLDNVLSATTRTEITYILTYDYLSRLTSKTATGIATVSYTYDLAGRTLTVSTPTVSGDPSTGTFTFSYDTAGHLYREQFPDGKTVTATMDSNGNVTQLAYPGSGNTVTRTIDQLNRVTATSGFSASIAIVYDSASRRVSQVNGNGTGQGYRYDKVDNLLALTIAGLKPNTTLGTPSRVDFAYLLNDAGQNSSKLVNDTNFLWQPSLANTITYGTANNLNQYPTVNSVTQTYDDNGCLLTDGTNTYVYDLESRLISVTNSGGTVTYKYDPFGRLMLKTTSSSSVRYLYSGMQRIEEYDNTSGSLLRRYVYGVGLDECLYTIDASTGAITYLHADETGSTILTTDSTGMPTRRNVYDPYGQLTSGSLSDMRIGYTGQFYEPETGLYLYKARHYSPKLGRFLQPDPIGYQGGMNLYEYCHGDPLNFSDPLGLSELGLGLAAGLGIAGMVIGGGLVVLKTISLFRDEPSPAEVLWKNLNLIAITTYLQLMGMRYRAYTPMSAVQNYYSQPLPPAPDRFSAGDPLTVGNALGVDIIGNRNMARAHKYNLLWFKEMVQYGGPWDFKARYRIAPEEVQNYGNWHYGVLAYDLGLSLEFAQQAAGVAQVLRHFSDIAAKKDPSNVAPIFGPLSNFDDPNDQAQIAAGYKWASSRYGMKRYLFKLRAEKNVYRP